MGQRVWIVDYGLGNLQSVYGAFLYFGVDAIVSDDRRTKADKVVLPGVGAFGRGMENLRKKGLVEKLLEDIKERRKPFFGICLGMQLLFDSSEESPQYLGLGIIRGVVRHLHNLDRTIRVPNIGWCETELSRCDIFDGLRDREYFYYVHSFYAEPEDKSVIVATVVSKVKYASAVVKDNIIGVQFHPERSGQSGLKVIQNFLKM